MTGDGSEDIFPKLNSTSAPDQIALRPALVEDDVTKMLAATTHIGSDNSETTMEQYVWKKKTDGVGRFFGIFFKLLACMKNLIF